MTKRRRSLSPVATMKHGRHGSSEASNPDAGDGLIKPEEDADISSEAVDEDGASNVSDDKQEDGDEDEDEENDEYEESGVYDAAQERLPFHVAYHSSLSHMEAAVDREMVGYGVFADNGAPPLSADMIPLVQRYEAVQNYSPPRPIIIGLLGAAGAGKSTVINSTLDCKNLAATGSAGSSCTNVVTEFCAAPSDQKDKFAANIIYLDSIEIEQLLRQHLHDVLAIRHADEEDWSADERQQGQRKVGTAVTAFSTIFADLQEFQSKDATMRTLEVVDEERADSFLRPLLHRCAQLTTTANALSITANTADKLNKRLSVYTQPSASSSSTTGKPGMWPLVSKVRVSLRNWHVLNGLKHLVFADVPGLQDENLVRVESAKKYLATCDALWVVSDICRVKDNAQTADLLVHAIAQHQSKAALVVTHSDLNLDEKTFTMLRNTGPESVECQNRLAKKKQILKEVSEARRRCQDKLDRKAKRQAHAMKERIERDLEDADHQFQDALMQLRNQSVVDHMRESTQKKFPQGARLQVFCVANDLYEKQNALGNSRRVNSARATNIPALREYALLLPTTAVYRSTKNFITGPYHDFLTGVDAWTKNAFLRDSNAIIEAIENIRKTAVARVCEHSKAIDQVSQRLIFDYIKENAVEYSQIAINVSKSWKRYRYFAYRKHCSQNGLVTRGDGSKLSSWNEELTAKLALDMESHCFHMLGFKQSVEMGNVTADLIGLMKDIKREIEKMAGSDSARFVGFVDQIDSQCEKIRELALEDFTAQATLIREISVRMSMDVYESFVARIMRPVYAKCASEHGKGMQQRMHTYMQQHMTTGIPFSQRVLTLTAAYYYEARKGRGERFAAQVGDIFRKLAENLRLMAGESTSRTDPMVEVVRTSLSTRVAPALVVYEEMLATFKELETSASGFDC